eukprot:3390407-Pyramimonas_sp.AAC.1
MVLPRYAKAPASVRKRVNLRSAQSEAKQRKLHVFRELLEYSSTVNRQPTLPDTAYHRDKQASSRVWALKLTHSSALLLLSICCVKALAISAAVVRAVTLRKRLRPSVCTFCFSTRDHSAVGPQSCQATVSSECGTTVRGRTQIWGSAAAKKCD